MMMCLRGSVCLYQGEELGLPEADVAFEDLQDPYGIQFWPEFKGRDGCRTPMVWETQSNGGFSEGSRGCLSVKPSWRMPFIVRKTMPTSLMHHYRRAIAFRRRPRRCQGFHEHA